MPDACEPRQHRATRAVQRLVEFAPSTGGLALWVRHVDAQPGITAPPAVTDGTVIVYGEAFENLGLAEQAGIVAHEVMHIALRHPQRYLDLRGRLGDVDSQLFNICADAIVNSALDHLGWLRLPSGSVFLDQILQQTLGLTEPAEALLLRWDVESLYQAIDDREPNRKSGKNESAKGGQEVEKGASGEETRRTRGQGEDAKEQEGGEPGGAGRQDGPKSAKLRALGAACHLDLVPDEQSPEAPEDRADSMREWRERLTRAHANDGAFSMLRALVADMPRSRVPWETVLRVQLARGLAMKHAVSWSRPTRSYIANQGRGGANRRLPWEPGFSSTQPVPRLALIVDVSGSIESGLLKRFTTEISAISRRQGCGFMLILGDDAVRQVEIYRPGRVVLPCIECSGGGGTDFTPLLQEADKFRPDICVVLTDLDGPVFFQPGWPVIWAVPQSHASAAAPFGRKLVLAA